MRKIKGDEGFGARILQLTTIGWTLALAIALGLGLGVLLDRRLHGGGRWTILGLLLGVGLAFVTLYRTLRRFDGD